MWNFAKSLRAIRRAGLRPAKQRILHYLIQLPANQTDLQQNYSELAIPVELWESRLFQCTQNAFFGPEDVYHTLSKGTSEIRQIL